MRMSLTHIPVGEDVVRRAFDRDALESIVGEGGELFLFLSVGPGPFREQTFKEWNDLIAADLALLTSPTIETSIPRKVSFKTAIKSRTDSGFCAFSSLKNNS